MGIERPGRPERTGGRAKYIRKPTGFFGALKQSDLAFRFSLGNGKQFHGFHTIIPDQNPLRDLLKLRQKSSGLFADQLEHTYTAISYLETDGLNREITKEVPKASRSLRELVRIAALYHDVGKVNGAFDPGHPSRSAEIARTLLKDPARSGVGALNDVDIDFVTLLIENHHLPGDLAKDFASGRFDMVGALSRINAALGTASTCGLSLKEAFSVLSKVSDADIASNFGAGSRELQNAKTVAGLLSGALINAESILVNERRNEPVKFGLETAASDREDKARAQGRRDRKPARGKMMENEAARRKEIDTIRAAQQERKDVDAFERHLANFVLERIDRFQIVRITFEDGHTIVKVYDESGSEKPVDEMTYKGPLARAFQDALIAGIAFKKPCWESVERENVKKIFALALEQNIDALKDIGRLDVAEVTMMPDEAAGSGAMPKAQFYHYTDREGFEAILGAGILLRVLDSKNGSVERRIYFSDKALSPDWVRDWHGVEGATYVIALNFKGDLKDKVKKKGRELILDAEDILLEGSDSRVEIVYAGPVPLGREATA